MVLALVGILIETHARGIRLVTASCATVLAIWHSLTTDAGLLVVVRKVMVHAAWQRHTNTKVLCVCIDILADEVRVLVSLKLPCISIALAEDEAVLDFLLLASVMVFTTFFLGAALIGSFLILALADIEGRLGCVGPLAAMIGTIVVEPLEAEACVSTTR